MLTRAITCHGAGSLELEELRVPEPASDEAVVRVRFGGICGSDLHYRRSGRVGESVIRAPLVLGHEVVGTVEVAAADGSGPAVGTSVFVHPATVCGRCDRCREGRPNLCPQLRYLGSAARFPHTPGGFADRLVVPVARLLPVDGLRMADAALIEPAAVAWHAVERALRDVVPVVDATGPRRAAVIGAGPIGALCVAVLRHLAPGWEVAATDVLERPLVAARRVGAHVTVPAAEAGRVLTDWAPEVVIESSGTVGGFAQALHAARLGGTVVAVGQLPPLAESPMQLIVGRELDVRGSSRFCDEAERVIAALRNGSLVVDGIVTHVRPAADVVAAFDLAADPAVSGKVLLDFA